ncbi:MAG TPA: phosphoribosylaminoimidazolesuccinocarboxamide synthase, partial [Phycisphaerales bacterium]|nr:phosphoribosylaminoimidazolesuccinocarboxamide synthase [Phycisphaerales bacterium]
MQTLSESHLHLPHRRQGKVRDLYDLPAHLTDGRLGEAPLVLIVATDRLSAFDVVLPTPIPGKGRLLTDMSVRWFDFIASRGLTDHHLLSTDAALIHSLHADQLTALEGRVMIARRCRVVPVECVARGYLDGSGWLDYQRTGAVCSVRLPAGLRRGDRLPEPIFTPATKEQVGTHDENIDF